MISNKKKAQLPIFDEWAKKPYWHCANEGIALSMGQDPTHVNPTKIKRNYDANAPGVVEFLKRLELWQRYETAENLESTATPEAFLRFAEATGMSCPKDLRKAVAEASKRLASVFGKGQKATAPAAEAKPSTRQADATKRVKTLEKIIGALARELKYGEDGGTDAITKLMGRIERGGGKVSQNTLRLAIINGLNHIDEDSQ